MKVTTLALLFIVLSAFSAAALPPAPPTLSQIVTNSELIVLVELGPPAEKVIKMNGEKIRRQRAKARTISLIKGTVPQQFDIAFDAASKNITCRPPDLAAGTFLLFLRKDGDVYALSNYWYSRASVEEGKVGWLVDAPTDLATLIAEIKKIGKAQ